MKMSSGSTSGFSFGTPAPVAATGGGGGFSFGGGAAPKNNSISVTSNNNDKNKDGSPLPSVRALAWDPTGTASLSICPLPSSSAGGNKIGTDANLDCFLSHDGTGCPTEETKCLLNCLDAREEWLAVQQQPLRRGVHNRGAEVTKLSMDYRAALCECLMSLQKKAAENTGNDEVDGNEEGNNVELLSLTYAISHLAEIFLLPSLASANTAISSYPKNIDGGFHDRAESCLDGPAGSLTADTVRYLRLHHTKGSFTDMPEVQAMLDSDQPEYYQISSTIVPGPYEHPYWNLVLQLVIQGEVAKAWDVLKELSACKHAEEDAAHGRELSPEGDGFAILQSILLSAPLPGGRGDKYCDDAGLDDYLEEELLEREEEEGNPYDAYDDEERENVEDPGELNMELINGLPSSAYLLWETLPRHANRLRTLRYRRDLRLCGRAVDGVDSLESSTVPELYQPRVALNAFQIWQDEVRKNVFPAGVGSSNAGHMSALFRRFPQLAQILSILVGTVPPQIANDSSLTWSESLLMELLYSRPDIVPDDIVTRAKVSMSRGGGQQQKPLQGIILSIMNGNAGQVVETMFHICGGSSGAALPATMTSLVCNLLVDAGCISPQQVSATSKCNTQTELLLLAAEAVLSSFSVQEQCDVGVRAAIRLLLPHAPPKRAPHSAAVDDSNTESNIIYEPRIAFMIAEALSHRLPASDSEARDLLQLCEDAITLGSVPIADACESVAFSRASYHRSKGNLRLEAHWLLRGMEIMSCWLPSDRQKGIGFASRRHFDALCETSANSLISLLSIAAVTNFSKKGLAESQEKELASVLRTAEEVLEGVVHDDFMASTVKGHVEVNLLQCAVDIALADAKGDTVQVATDIVHCLEEKCLSEDYGGVVSTLADPKMYEGFLHIAFAILLKEEEASKGGPMESCTCAFTLHGMHVLMARLTQVLAWEGVISSDESSTSHPSNERKEYYKAMQLACCKGLMRIMANKQSTATKAGPKKKIGLEEEIELMLSPCV